MGATCNWLGLDIGGANLKAANTNGFALSMPFALWQQPTELASAISQLLAHSPEPTALAVTMTGELADCYEGKQHGVSQIANAVVHAAGNLPVWFYGIDSPSGTWHTAQDAEPNYLSLAASNWHALASVGSTLDSWQSGILLDVGSTTTDIIPFASCGPTSVGQDDTARLLAGELIYAGVGRTPICSLVETLPYRGQRCPIARELFATTADASLLAGHTAESSVMGADGRAMTGKFSQVRMARMVGADASCFSMQDAKVAADHVIQALVNGIAQGLQTVLSRQALPPKVILLSGEGAWAGKAALDSIGCSSPRQFLKDRLGDQVSRCAPAWAVARLAEQQLR